MSRYAATEDEAEARYFAWVNTDPFPSIPPALLNSADVRDYVSATGMITPFNDDAERLKPGSYEVPLLGDYVYWEESERREGSIGEGDLFQLKPNSIAFVTLEPMFRLPSYIALRFNLRIKHVYQGLLLGTGPLVDPGFVGRLSIPLHNLTTNEYHLRGGDGMIWMEFTKLSPDPHQTQLRKDARQRTGVVTPLAEYKRSGLTVRDYLHRAAEGRPVQSSIPAAVRSAEQRATAAELRADAAASSAQSLTRILTISSVIAIIALVVTGVAVVAQLLSLVNDVNVRIDDLQSRIENGPPATASPD